MNYNEIVATQIGLMEALLEATYRTNDLLEDVLTEQLDSNNIKEEFLAEIAYPSTPVNEVDDDEDYWEDEDYIDLEDECDCEHCLSVSNTLGQEDFNKMLVPSLQTIQAKQEKTPDSSLELLAYEMVAEIAANPQLPVKFDGYGKITYEYIPDANNPIELTILKERKVVIATMKDKKGKVLRKQFALCNEDDAFSAYIGAAIAVHRLFDLEVPAILLQ